MSQPLRSTRRDAHAGLTIGDLAERTGVAVQTLRMWENRYGFPEPERLLSGHRRYTETDAELVRTVVRMREDGSRLDAAIERVRAGAGVATDRSMFAEMRNQHPELPVHRMRKRTLMGISWAIEDDFAAKAQRSHVFGSFEETRFYRPARPRWIELAKVAHTAHVFAGFDDGSEGTQRDLDEPPTPRGPWAVPLPADHPMRREWNLVCDASDLPVALTAFELPGQRDRRDSDRVFEAIWTVDPVAVRTASRVCAAVAAEGGSPVGREVVDALVAPPVERDVDTVAISRLVGRILAYVNDAGRY